MNSVKWVLIDQTEGATTKDGSKLSTKVLANIADAVKQQLNGEYAKEYGTQVDIRVAANAQDIQPDEWAYGFVPQLPDAPGASAYHDIHGNGVPFSLCAVETCKDLYGPEGISVDASHEILETAGDIGANLYSDDKHGLLHAYEMCDAVELQTYPKACKDGTVAQVSNWLMRAWFIPDAAGPYDYMTSAGLHSGAVGPNGPLNTAKGNGGNYQIVCKATPTHQVHAMGGDQASAQTHIEGTRHKGQKPNWSSRAARRLGLRPANLK
jgi:hypothetical protein